MIDPYIRLATVHRVIDGDTFELQIDLGYRVTGRFIIRLRGIDCAELPTPAGLHAKAVADQLLRAATQITVKSYKDRMTFARWVGDVWLDDVPMVEALTRALAEGTAADA